MKIRALKGFSGALSMAAGETIECQDKELIADLLQAGYIEEIKERAAPKRSKRNEAE